ncbi:MAG: hypothetical protein JSV90_08205 [Methanobacteriota archaeon]|nr:MAG: hypothetical protein JSV90_08205 [Euryarchaeota archaeon]
MPQYSTNKRYPQREKSRQRLQRTLRSLPSDQYESRVRPNPAREFASPYEADEVVSAASQERIQQTSEPSAEVQYQCTSCDMMVSSSDSYCPFCGAIFADDPSAEGASAEAEEPYRPPDRFDVLSLMKPRAKTRELLYAEALHGFAGSARLLEEIETVITEVSSLGTDTLKARRLITDAWEACREGDWPLVSALARQTEELISPSIPDLVRGELAKARNLIVEAKAHGADKSHYIVMMKSAMSALHANNVDEALRITKQLLDSLREDSAMRKGGPARSTGR